MRVLVLGFLLLGLVFLFGACPVEVQNPVEIKGAAVAATGSVRCPLCGYNVMAHENPGAYVEAIRQTRGETYGCGKKEQFTEHGLKCECPACGARWVKWAPRCGGCERDPQILDATKGGQ